MKKARAVILDSCGLQNFVAFGTMLFSYEHKLLRTHNKEKLTIFDIVM